MAIQGLSFFDLELSTGMFTAGVDGVFFMVKNIAKANLLKEKWFS